MVLYSGCARIRYSNWYFYRAIHVDRGKKCVSVINSKDTFSGVPFLQANWFGWVCCRNLWHPDLLPIIRNVLSNFQGLRQGHAFYPKHFHRAFTFIFHLNLPISKISSHHAYLRYNQKRSHGKSIRLRVFWGACMRTQNALYLYTSHGGEAKCTIRLMSQILSCTLAAQKPYSGFHSFGLDETHHFGCTFPTSYRHSI